ncbi:hypothetical protein FA13DRAFT_1797706 [Coprinellus micaceus]|uniref:Uncharacterized protein n=1 Tax=Coprinellus micaceus TaxID=71717 RepID=A0A4Y7SPN0_COPMI|nr:hypothetical protein FA13DRAFT_1797706 [Coprinellus micaceus]
MSHLQAKDSRPLLKSSSTFLSMSRVAEKKGIPALNAAVGNTSRPAYINFLSIEIDGSEWSHPADQSTIEMFLRAAPSMSGLKDLRIRLREELSANISGMNDMLCAGRFQLTTLFVDEELDFPRIVQEQKELNVVMIYSSDDFPALPMLLSAPISRPLIMLGLAQEPTVYPMFLNHLAIAPEIVSPSHTSLGDLVKAAFRRDVMRGFRLRLDEIKIISVFLQSPTWQDSIQPYMKCVVDLFTEIDELHIHLHSPGEFKSRAYGPQSRFSWSGPGKRIL